MSSEIPTAAQPATPADLMRIALDQNADLDRLEKLMELQQRWQNEQDRKAFYAALAEFKANPPKLVKNHQVDFETNNGGSMHYKHATLDEVTDKIARAMGEHGLSHGFDVEQTKEGVKVTCKISHKDGHSESVSLFAGVDNSGKKNAIQALGSTITYLSRYSLLAVTGLATGTDDDDGHATSGRDVNTGKPSAARPSEVNTYEPGRLYEGKIAFCEQRQSRNGNPYGKINIQTDEGCIEMSFFSRPESMKEIEPESWHTLEGQECSFTFTEAERNGTTWRNLELLDFLSAEAMMNEPGSEG